MASSYQRQRARIGRDPNYTLAQTKTREEYHGIQRSPRDALIDADYPRVDPEEAIRDALARLDNWT